MDSLLPSEVARLVLGYLQEQKCDEATKMFMETSPLLQECRIVAQRGGRYSTKVGGLSLMDILDKYCAASAMVQEKLSKASDSEQLKQCNDLLEQLRYLLEGSRGHRFVVNISVPSQNSPAGSFGSPIVSGNTRKRHHSNSERGKRVARSLSNLMEKTNQNAVTQSCDTVEATPLESLPGHKASGNQIDIENHANVLNDKFFNKNDFMTNTSKESRVDVPSSTVNTQPYSNSVPPYTVNSNLKDQATEMVQRNDLVQTPSKCTAGTNTEKLMNYCTAEVQTGPFDLAESESDLNDEPIENLTLLTSVLLHHTELHERIADNINKAIIPVESSFREDNIYDNAADANITLLNDFDNAIKSVVKATESDPVFEGFINEIFKIGEDTSPDEDSDGRHNQGSNKQLPQNYEAMEVDNNSEFIPPTESRTTNQEPSGSEVPLKQRLRSSSKSQNANIDEEEKDSNSLLENQNAEAIMSIVNVITSKRNSLAGSEETNKEVSTTQALPDNSNVNEPAANVKIQSEKTNDDTKAVKSSTKKARKTKVPKQKPVLPEPEVMPTLILCTERDVESLISKRTSEGYLPIAPRPSDPNSSPLPAPCPEQPTIYLRTVNVPRHLVNPAQLEATPASSSLLQQALQLQLQHQQQFVGSAGPQLGLEPMGATSGAGAGEEPIVVPVVVADDRRSAAALAAAACQPVPLESITLYGGGGDAAQMNVAPITSMPIISLDDSSINLASGTGLSPFFKGGCSGGGGIAEQQSVVVVGSEIGPTRKLEDHREVPEEVAMDVEVHCPVAETAEAMEEVAEGSKESKDSKEQAEKNEDDVPPKVEEQASAKSDNTVHPAVSELIAKRTPRTLLKSRAKNNRLSLSTPRRRNSHVRALDFNTPVKLGGGTGRKISQSCARSKSVCRAGLFKSPPFTGGVNANVPVNLNANPNARETMVTRSVKRVRTISPVKRVAQQQQQGTARAFAPIATRSPAPKLQGNWGKLTGIGLILGETSTSESSPEKSQAEGPPSRAPSPPPVAKVSEKKPEETKKTEPAAKKPEDAKPVVQQPVVKKSWDSDLRKIVGAAASEQSNRPRARSSKKGRRRPPVTKVVSDDAAAAGDAGVEDEAAKAATKDIAKEIAKETVKEIVKETAKQTVKETTKAVVAAPTTPATPPESAKEPSPQLGATLKSKPISPAKAEITPPAPPPVSKRPLSEPSTSSSPSKPPNDKTTRNISLPKISPETHGPVTRFPDMLDLETPRKTETATFYVPPTPRLLSTPGDSLKSHNRSKADLRIKDCVSTPDFPVTPCIVLTPKIIEEDNEKKASPYYEPSDEQPAKLQEIVERTERVVIQETTTLTIQKNVVELQENKSIEITQFGVIEGQIIPEEEKEEDPTTSEENSKEILEESSVEETNASANSYSDSDESSDSNSSSSSSSSSNSSSSSSSSCSSSASSPTKSIIQENDDNEDTGKVNTETIEDPQDDAPEQPPQAPTESESEIDSPDLLLQSFSKLSQEDVDRVEESSPAKLFPVTKDISDGEIKETPAKDENLIEATIGETPSVTDAERALRRDSLTSLASKISAIITTSESDRSMRSNAPGAAVHREATCNHKSLNLYCSDCPGQTEETVNSTDIPAMRSAPSKPKILHVQTLAPNDGMALQVSKMLQSDMQQRHQLSTIQQQQQQQTASEACNAKLSLQLEEKRRRVMAKFKEATNPKIIGQTKRMAHDEGKQPKKTAATKKPVEVEKVAPSTTDNLRSKSKQHQTLAAETAHSIKVDNKDAKKPEEKPKEAHNPKKVEEETKEPKKSKGKSSPRKKTVPSDQPGKTEKSAEANPKKLEKEPTPNPAKEVPAAATVPITGELAKGISKSKVDQVKRDLFSDEETNDQRTTRSQTARRTTIDGQKNLGSGNPPPQDENRDVNVSLDSSKEKMPGVLECLHLVPANTKSSDQQETDCNKNPRKDDGDCNKKSLKDGGDCNKKSRKDAGDGDKKSRKDAGDGDKKPRKDDGDDDKRERKCGFKDSSQGKCLDVSIVYDESVPIKKRKRKYSSSELEPEYYMRLEEESEETVHVMTVTAFDELFKMVPRVSGKKKVTLVQSPKKSPVKQKKGKATTTAVVVEQPLATSSPLIKVAKGKEGKHSDDKKKKACKRKNSPAKEKQVEKKSKPDPQTLFNKIKIDDFLKSVHVPE